MQQANHVASGARNPLIDGIVDPLAPFRHQMRPVIRHLGDHVERPVGRAAILNDVLYLRIALALDAANGIGQRFCAVADGCNDGDFHGVDLHAPRILNES